ncbi:MAG: hypothetical protein ABEJ66_01035 [Candidatus Nanohaloarchaea archaeon]
MQMLEDEKKEVHVSFRTTEEHAEFLDGIVDQWDLKNRTQAIILIHHAFMGIIQGRLEDILDPERLEQLDGELSDVLANYLESDLELPENLSQIRLKDVLVDVDELVGAAELEPEEM